MAIVVGGTFPRRLGVLAVGLFGLAGLLWFGAFPWTPYAACGASRSASLPSTVRIGLYEEFPSQDRLDKLRYLDYPVSLALAASSRVAFLRYRDMVERSYPQVRAVFFWPLLSWEEGYYPGAWSDAAGVRRIAAEADGLPVVWDLELPRDLARHSAGDWWTNRTFLDRWLRHRTQPTHIWRSTTALGLDTAFLRLSALHFDPSDYPGLSLQLDLYATGEGLADLLLKRMLRCGVERCADRFIASFGVLNDGASAKDVYVPMTTLRRYLRAARETGVAEVWLFGVNGLNEAVAAALREALPVPQ